MPLEPWQWVHKSNPGVMWRSTSRVLMIMVASLGRVTLKWLSNFEGHNIEILQKAINNRPEGQPVITVGNHISCVDDPLVFGGCLPMKTFYKGCPRWIPGAADITFTAKRHVYFFSLGRIVPIIRGDGVYQKGIDFCISKLHQGGWVHFFSEGKINMNHELLRLKWGVGRAIAESQKCPIVIPFWHVGCDDLLPNYPPYYPRFGKKITLLVGKPLDFRDTLARLKEECKSPIEIRKAITDMIQNEFKVLKEKAEALHYSRR